MSDFDIFKSTDDDDNKETTFLIHGGEIDFNTEDNRFKDGIGMWVRLVPRSSERFIKAAQRVSDMRQKGVEMDAQWRKDTSLSAAQVQDKGEKFYTNLMAQFFASIIKEFYGTKVATDAKEFKTMNVADRFQLLAKYPKLVEFLTNNFSLADATDDVLVEQMIKLNEAEVANDTEKKSGDE